MVISGAMREAMREGHGFLNYDDLSYQTKPNRYLPLDLSLLEKTKPWSHLSHHYLGFLFHEAVEKLRLKRCIPRSHHVRSKAGV